MKKVPSNLQCTNIIGTAKQARSFGNPVMLLWDKITLLESPAIDSSIESRRQGNPKAFPTVDHHPLMTARHSLPSQ